jgi:CelD/BcsL family acetyltransferase involved in cellulose biosynthesis
MDLIDAGSPRVARIWQALERFGTPSYFQSWAWISTWLRQLPPGEAPVLAVLGPDASPRAACFLSRRRLVRHGFVSSRALFLNVTGDPRLDDLTIEHNAILVDPAAPLTLRELVAALPDEWDELLLPALSPDAFPGNALGEVAEGATVVVERTSGAPFVDLDQVRGAPGGYLSLLSSGTRAQIRRAQRKFGTITLEVAAELPQALDVYAELVDLHGRSWQARGLPGSFADAWFDGFHRALIGERFAAGEIQLCRVRAGGATVGCLYSFVAGGRVHFYQSGFASYDDPHLKPGYVCHVEAIQHDAAAGLRIYDFLAGATQYKQSMATGAATLSWVRLQRPRARFAVEARLRAWKKGLSQLAGTLRGR